MSAAAVAATKRVEEAGARKTSYENASYMFRYVRCREKKSPDRHVANDAVRFNK